MIKPTLENLKDTETPLGFCTDEGSQKRRTLAEMIAAEGGPGISSAKAKGKERVGEGSGYDFEWCVAALEVEGGNLDKARGWLKDYAPTKAEERR